MSKFPGAYVQDVKKDDSLMVYVPMDNTDIGARPVSTPKTNKNGMSLEHVGSGK